MIAEHETGLDKILELCRDPRRAIDVFPALFRARITDGNLLMATGESIAHLNYLLDEGALDTWIDDNGVRWYQRPTT